MKFRRRKLRFNLRRTKRRRKELLEHYGEQERYPDFCSAVLPRYLVNIKHVGPLRALAFSDYRVHDVDLLLSLLKRSAEKPDIILYAGDDIDRFVAIPESLDILSYEKNDISCSMPTLRPSKEGVVRQNYFEELANESRYGIGVIRGNDDDDYVAEYIKGEKVYNLHHTWLRIGSYLVIGLECSPMQHSVGISTCLETDYKQRLELAISLLKRREKLIVVSHAPPFGILDRAMRFGDRSIGSIALRELIEESSDVILIVCGHVHRWGGMQKKLNNTTIVNVSSHDSNYARANIAWIVIEDEEVEVKFEKLPSPMEQVLREVDKSLWQKVLVERFRSSRQEAELLIKAYERFGDKLYEDLEHLARLKFEYGFTWDNVFRLYAYGVKSPEGITKEVYLRVLSESSFPHNVAIKKAYLKLIREREKGTYLLNPLPFSSRSKLVVFDLEYIPGGQTVLFGFLDLTNNEIRQFWFYQQRELSNFLEKMCKENYVFIHWGGEDKSRLLGLVKRAKVVNLLYYSQTSLALPTRSNRLEDIYDELCGHKDDEWWEKFFYKIRGPIKLDICRYILSSRDPEYMKILSESNKADLLALACIVRKILELELKNAL